MDIHVFPILIPSSTTPHLYPFLCQWTFWLLPFLAILSSAAMNIDMHVSFQIMVFSGHIQRKRPGVGLLDHMVVLFLLFLWNLHTFSIVAVSIYIPTSSTGWVRKITWSRKWQPTQVFLPGKFHGQRSLACYNPWDCKESDMTEHSCTAIQEGSFFFTPSPACIVCRPFDDGHSDGRM